MSKTKPQRCSRGKTIRTIQMLAHVLASEPSIWVRYADRPLPSAFIASQPFRLLIASLQHGTFSRVVRPPQPLSELL